ncbi:unnamed protein product [Oncorhynchus mykiss]|uniref:Plectin-like n=1 Tax=Oncorhynchus mykiss TaxID=8022 RepID=A0A060XDZ8_ONCMY|nr:unnamed protein product [Oncorhynchus mykiss]
MSPNLAGKRVRRRWLSARSTDTGGWTQPRRKAPLTGRQGSEVARWPPSRASWESQAQPPLWKGRGFRTEASMMEESQGKRASTVTFSQTTEASSSKAGVSSQETIITKVRAERSQVVPVQKNYTSTHESQVSIKSVSSKTAFPLAVTAVASAAGAGAALVKVSAESSFNKAGIEKPKKAAAVEEAPNVSAEPVPSKPAIPAPLPPTKEIKEEKKTEVKVTPEPKKASEMTVPQETPKLSTEPTKSFKVEITDPLSVVSGKDSVVTEKVIETKKGMIEDCSKSKKKKKSPRETTKAESPVTKVSPEKGLKTTEEETQEPPKPPPAFASSIKPKGPESTKETKAEVRRETKAEVQKSNEADHQIPKPAVEQSNTKSIVSQAASHPVAAPQVQEKAETTNKVASGSSGKFTHGSEMSVTKVEMVKVQKTIEMEMKQEALNPVETFTLPPQPPQPAIVPEAKAPIETAVVDSSKAKKAKKKKQVSSPDDETTKSLSPPAAKTSSPTEKVLMTRAAVKVDFPNTPGAKVMDCSPKMPQEGMWSEETSMAAAVQAGAPALDKGEAEPAQLSAEKKREDSKPKTSSAREAPGETASAGAEARASLHTEQGELPRVVAKHALTAAQSTEEEKKSLSVPPKASEQEKNKEPLQTPATTADTTPLPAQPHLEDTCDQPVDEANMRKKIVVVEEVIEVQHITSPQAVAGGEVPPAVVPEITGQELDFDVLHALAVERALLAGGAVVESAQSTISDDDWDHSLDVPEEKTFPNFIEDERDRVQKKTFTKWVNKHLIKSQRQVTDLYEDLRDGHNLISLLEVLSGETLPREKGRMRFHKLQNVQMALDFLKHRQVKLVNIRNDDIADGNPKLTLGLIWTIILHFQISDIQVNGQSDNMTAKEKLLMWSQSMVEGYQGIRCDNFTTSWRDGKLFSAVIHKHQPRLIDMSKVYRQTNVQNLEYAFNVAETDLGVTRLLDPEDVDVPHPDEKSIITYVSSLYDAMPRDVQDGIQANELELRWTEYYELVTIIRQWISHHVVIFGERRFPGSYEEIEILWRQFLKFKETELPAKEADKHRSKLIYQSFESAVHAGQVKVPPGYHPIDVEKEWGRLHVSILERERLLRIEFERLERLQRIVSKVQMESGVCEEQLNQLETLLQTDIRLLSAGKPAQHTAEMERDLDKADGMIRLLFNDVQLLKDGRHLQAEQMYRRVYRLHERLVNLRTDYNLRLKSQMIQSIQQPSTRARPEMDEVTLRYAQDLLTWVEESQRRIDEAEWGSDLPTVESQLGSHRGLHQTVEDFRAKIDRAKADETQLSPVSKGTYSQYLGKLDLQYAKLLNSSKSRLRNLDSLYVFVSAATKELMWLNDKEEEEVNYDWSDRNTNMTAKKDNYSGLMRELELREKKVNDIQATGDKMLKEGHPGKKTVEAFTAALQTQWSWILQLCCCIEAHLKENTAYYQFFSDVKEAEERMKKMQEMIKKKYSCDRSTTATRLEDLLQDAMEEKEQLNEFKTHVAGLNKRAKTIIQLKPRNPTKSIKGKLPIQAVCDFKQMEITVHKGEECALINNSPQPNKWKVLNRSGIEAVVPSVCFLVPPVNKEAMDSVSSLDSGHQSMLILWQRMHVDMKSMLSWQYLTRDITQIRNWNITMFKTMKVEEYRLIMRNLELHYQDFMRDSQDSQLFGPHDRMQIEGDYSKTTQYYDNLLRSVEKGEQDESTCVTYITQIKDLRLRIEDCEARTVARIRKPVDKDPLKDCAQKTTDQKVLVFLLFQKVQVELEGIKRNLDQVAVKTEEVLNTTPKQSSTAPVLRSELEFTLKKMDHAYILSSVYLEKLKTVDVVIRNTQGAEGVLKKYEQRLREVQTVPDDVKEVEKYRTQLKKMRAEAEGEKPAFDSLEGELGKAAAVSEKMSRVHSERDAELDHYRHLLSGLQDRWQAVFSQMDLRQRELEQLGRQLGYYRESYDWLIQWIGGAKQRQEKIQAVPISDSKTLKEQLAQEKTLLEEIEQNKEKVDECQKYAKAYIDTIKASMHSIRDYELQLVAYKAQVDPLSPLKKTKMDSASDNIIQEYVTLRTRYSELMTLTSQYIKFITDTQRRLEDEEKAAEKMKAEDRKKMAEMQAELNKQKQLAESHAKAIAKAEQEAQELKLMMQEEVSRRQVVSVDAEKQKHNIQLELHELKNLSEQQIKSKSQQLKQLREKASEAERLRKLAQEEAEKLRKQVNEETQKKRKAEEELKLKSEAEKEAAKQKQKALEDLEKLKMQAEEAERRMKQAEVEKERQIKVAQEVAQKSAATELQSKRMSYVEKTSKLEESLKLEHVTVIQLQEEAARLKKQQEEADMAREEAEKELEKWRQKANEALRLRLQAEEEAHKKSRAQEDAEKQKEDAEREARKRAKAEESALKQKDMAEQELERQRRLAEGTAQQKLSAEQELIRLRADFEHAEQQRSLLDDELYRLKNEVSAAEQQRKQLEDELAKVRSEMNAARQRAEAERILKEKLAAINEATRMKTEAEIALKEKEAENERLRRQAEDEAYQRKALEDQASQHKQDIEEKINQLKKSSENELGRQKTLVDETLKQRRVVEEEIRILKLNFEKASSGKLDLELELNKLKNIAEETQQSKLQAEKEAEKHRKLALEEEKRRREAEEKILVSKQAAQKCNAAEQQVQTVLVQQKEDNLMQKQLKGEYEKAKMLAKQAELAKEKAEKEAALLRQQAEDAERQKQAAELEAANQAKAQEEAVKLRKEAEFEAAKRAQAEADAIKQKQQADAEMEKHKKLAEQTVSQKSQVEKELAKVRLQLDETDKQKSVLDEELQRLKDEIQMEELVKLKLRIEQENQQAAHMRQIAESDLSQQRALAEKMLKEKMLAIQEACKLKAEAEMLQRQKDLAQEQAQKLLEDKQLMQQRLEEETEGFQKSLEAERRRQLEITAEAENLKVKVSQLSDAQSKAENEAKKFKKQADEISARLHQTELATKEKFTFVETQRLSSNNEADELRKAIADLEKEKAKLKKEAEDLQNNSKEMVNAQQKQIQREKTVLQQTFVTEKAELLKKEKQIEEEKKKLENQFEEEVKKAKALKEEQDRQRKQMEQEKDKLQATMDAALNKQKEAEKEMLNKQKEMQELERKRLEQEKLLGEENKKLREKLQQLEVAHKEPDELIHMTMVETTKQVINGQSVGNEVDSKKDAFSFDGIREKVPARRLYELKKGKATVQDLSQTDKLRTILQGKNCIGGVLTQSNQKMAIYQAMKENKITPGWALILLEAQAASGYETKDVFSKTTVSVPFGKFKGKTVTIWEIINSEYFTEDQRKDLIRQYKTGKITVEKIIKIVITMAEEKDKKNEIAFEGLRGTVLATELLESKIIDKDLYNKLHTGNKTIKEVSEMEPVQKSLKGTNCIAGVVIDSTKETMSFYQAMKKDMMRVGPALTLLEAQAGTGFVVDPIKNQKYTVDEAVKATVIGPELHEKLLSAERGRCVTDKKSGLQLLPLSEQAINAKEEHAYTEVQTKEAMSQATMELQSGPLKGKKLTIWEMIHSEYITEEQRIDLMRQYRSGTITIEKIITIVITIVNEKEAKKQEQDSFKGLRAPVSAKSLFDSKIIDKATFDMLQQGKKTPTQVSENVNVSKYLQGSDSIAGVYLEPTKEKISIYQAMKKNLLRHNTGLSLLEAQAATGSLESLAGGSKSLWDIMNSNLLPEQERKKLMEEYRSGSITKERMIIIIIEIMEQREIIRGETVKSCNTIRRRVTIEELYNSRIIDLETFNLLKQDKRNIRFLKPEIALSLLEAQAATGFIIDPVRNETLTVDEAVRKGVVGPEIHDRLLSAERAVTGYKDPYTDIATQRGYINKETNKRLADDVKGFVDPVTEEKVSYAQLLKRLMFKGLRKQITIEEMLRSQIIDQQTVNELNEGLISVEEVSPMKKNMIRPGTAFELLEAQAASGYVIDPIKNLKLTVNESVKMGIVGPEFKDKLLSAERAVTGYRDPYSGKTISLFQAMKKGLILKDHGIRLLEAQIATGGIIDPEESHRLPVEVAYNRGLFDEEMNEILTDPSDDTKGFFDPNTEENLTYLGLMERCITDPATGLVLLLLKEKKRERKTSSKSSVRKRRVVIVDPDSGKEMTVYEAFRKQLIDHQTYLELSEQECEWEEITQTSSDGVVKSMIIDRRSGRQYDIDDALARGLIDQTSLSTYRSGNLSITEFADMLSGNMGGFRSRSSSFGSTSGSTSSSYNPMSPIPSIRPPAIIWNDPTEETGPVAGILDTDTLEKVSVTEAMHRNLVDNITGQRLLEAQACTGGIIDPTTGERFAATEKGLVDKVMVDRINLAHKAFNGFEDPRTKVKMSASQALKKGWLYYEAGQRFLEVQYLTGGLIEPDSLTGRIHQKGHN